MTPIELAGRIVDQSTDDELEEFAKNLTTKGRAAWSESTVWQRVDSCCDLDISMSMVVAIDILALGLIRARDERAMHE